jgi:DNA replication and repair protein RecF
VEIRRLEVRNLRCLREVTLEPAPGLNLLTGDNGAGKTSVLEALHLMAYGRSFRGRVRDGLVRSGTEAVEVFAAWQEDGGGARRAGLRHTGQSWEGRLDGNRLSLLGELCRAFMVVTFEPGSHALVSGGGEPRRRFVDWGLFHVEPDFLDLWRRHARALKQRNALLKNGAGGRQLDAWDHELAESGEAVTLSRQQYLVRLQDRIADAAAELAPGLGTVALSFQPGWRREELSLADALLLARDRDCGLGYTSVGPQRADWRLEFAALPNREPLSRGQGKLAALSCLLAQARDCADQRGDWPVVALDDLASELDPTHQQRLLAVLLRTGAQLFVTGTGRLAAAEEYAGRMFHVEHGQINTLAE